MTRLAIASIRSSTPRLHDLRSDEDDRRRDVDPGQEPRGESERAVRLEDLEGSREEAEGDLGDLPEHGRYQRGPPGRVPRHRAARGEPEHEVEEPEADGHADQR